MLSYLFLALRGVIELTVNEMQDIVTVYLFIQKKKRKFHLNSLKKELQFILHCIHI